MRRLLLSALLSLWTTASALAGVTCVLPFNLQNNTTADATQVMANYNALVACLQSAAAAGANSDITSIIGLTTPLSIAQGGSSSYIGGTSTGSANAQVVATVTPNGFSLSAGKRVIFLAGFTNNAATQINIGGTGLTNVFKQSSGGPIAMTGGEIIAGQLYEIIYDGTQYEILPYVAVGWGLTGALGGPSIATTNPPYPADTAVNLQLNASVGSNLLTVAIKNNSGTDPSTTNPVLLPFRDSSATGSGAPVWVAITSALSINTNAVGASMGCISGKMCRLWAVAFNDGGTPVMAFFNALSVSGSTVTICPFNPAIISNSTAVSAAANLACTFYTPNGTTVTSRAFVVLGYVDISEATAGTYITTPSVVQLFTPGIRLPGVPISTVACASASCGITPTSAANPVKVSANITWNPQTTLNTNCNLVRSGPTTIATINIGAPGNTIDVACNFASILDTPGTASPLTYAASMTTGVGVGTSNYTLEEIMR